MKKHFFLSETSTRFLLEQKDSILERIWKKHGLIFLDHKNGLLWVDGAKNEELNQRIRKKINVLDENITDQMFFDLMDFKMHQDSVYRGFILRNYELPISFLEHLNHFLLSRQQPAMRMLLIVTDEQEELSRLMETNKLYIEIEDKMTSEERAQNTLYQKQSLITPFKSYYQQHNLYHEINISGKNEDTVFAEICAIIDNI